MIHKIIRLAGIVGMLAITISACGQCDCTYVLKEGDELFCDAGWFLCGPYKGRGNPACTENYDAEKNQHYTCCDNQLCLNIEE